MSSRTYTQKEALQAALAYSRWLHNVTFNRWLNAKRAECGLPPDPPPVCLNTMGERIYKEIRGEVVAAYKSKTGAVMLEEGERRAVVDEIIRRLEVRTR